MKRYKKNILSTATFQQPRTLSAWFLGLIAITALQAAQPKLVVGIVIDGLSRETLEMLRPHLEKGGFNRFYTDGVIFNNVDYGTNTDAAASTAMLMTGASPKVNGISGETVYDPVTHRSSHVFADETALGNFTKDALSPNALKLSTLSDEIRIAGAGVTYVHSIAADPSIALILSSHAGNTSVWFDNNTGKWASTTYYSEMPPAAANANRGQSLSLRIDTMQWTPSAKTAVASSLPEHLTLYPFRYTFAGKDVDKYSRFASSPLLNREITQLAQQYITGLDLGKHDGTDVLNLGYTLKPYRWSKTAENRYELYDSYVKLDDSLAKLFSTIDSTIGIDNAIVYISGTPPRPQRRKDDEKWKIPGGEFSTRKAVSLLNLYLIALHGNGEWVTAYHDGHFYLNKDLANSLEKDITEIRRQSADFLIRMAGVGHSYTIDDIVRADEIVPNASGQARNTVIDQAGDVTINLIPGWSLVDDFNMYEADSSQTYSPTPPTSVFMLLSPEIETQRIDTPVDARAIAPSIAGMMNIRPPNGADTPPVSLRFK